MPPPSSEALPLPVAPPTEAELFEAMLGLSEPEPAAPAGEKAAPVALEVEKTPPPAGTLRFELNGKEIVTAGITKDTLFKTFKLGAMVDELEGKGRHKDLLGREFGIEHRHELTEAQGKRYVAELVKIVNRHGGKA